MQNSLPSPSDDLQKQKFEDVLRRLDHHAYIVRVSTTDFFKTMFLVQGGGLVTLCITILSHLTTGTPSQASVSAFPEALVNPIRGIAVNLSVGMALSFLGYLFSCNRAHRKTVEYRQILNDYLYEGAIIEAEKTNIDGESKRVFAFFFVLALIFASVVYDTISMVIIIERVMAP